jgi:hypothetical protein
MFNGRDDLREVTVEKLRSRFSAEGVPSWLLSKVVAFFLEAASHAGIAMSASVRNIPGVCAALDQTDKPKTWEEFLLSKVPDFDPTWPEQTRAVWFDMIGRIKEIAGK